MKKTLSLIISSFLSFAVHAQTYYGPTQITNATLEHTTIHGTADLTKVKTDSLLITGPLQFKNLEVIQDTQIFGAAKGSDGKFGELKITGAFDGKQIACDALTVIGATKIKRLAVVDKTEVIGPLDIEDGRLQNLTVTADAITLNNVEVGNILIKDDHSQKQVLNLKGKTNVSGSITFESGRGVLTQDKDVTVKGEIKGAIGEKN